MSRQHKPRFCTLRCFHRSVSKGLDEKLWSRVVKSDGDGCWEWQGHRTPFGHGQLTHRGVSLYAHRVSWELLNGPIPDGASVCHRCDNPPCVRPSHLWLGSQRDNLRDMADKGRQGLHVDPSRATHGVEHHKAKLTPELVREIRSSSESIHALSRRMGVARPTIKAVLSGRTWRHVE